MNWTQYTSPDPAVLPGPEVLSQPFFLCPTWIFFFFFFLFVVDFVIHWNEAAMGLHVFPIPIPPPTSLSTRSLWVFPVHQVRALVSCIPPGLVNFHQDLPQSSYLYHLRCDANFCPTPGDFCLFMPVSCLSLMANHPLTTFLKWFFYWSIIDVTMLC